MGTTRIHTRPTLFNIFINYLFSFIEKIKVANYADDNTTYSTEKYVETLLHTLQGETSEVLNWFRINEMKSNDDKCHLIVADQEHFSITLGQETIEASDSVELSGINIDKKLNFNEHIPTMLKKGNQKLHASAKISKYLSQ